MPCDVILLPPGHRNCLLGTTASAISFITFSFTAVAVDRDDLEKTSSDAAAKRFVEAVEGAH